jgi:hypothetical protein
MRRKMIMTAAVVVVCGLALPAAYAGGMGGNDPKAGLSAPMPQSAAPWCKPNAPFPSMTIKVGTKTYNRWMDAERAAKAANANVTYLVGDQTYNNHDEAMTALANESENFVQHFLKIGYVEKDGKIVYRENDPNEKSPTEIAWGEALTHRTRMAQTGTPTKGGMEGAGRMTATPGEHGTHTTPMEGTPKETDFNPSNYLKFIVAGRECNNLNTAEKTRDDATAAIKNVKVEYLVDGKSYKTWTNECEQARAAGTLTYRIGSDRTSSEDFARVTLARTQWEAVKFALEKPTKTTYGQPKM